MKTVFKILGGIAIFVVIVLVSVFSVTAGVPEKADLVVSQFNNGDIRDIYNDSVMTDDFTFEEFSEAMGIGYSHSLVTAKKIKWKGRGFEGGEKYIYGDFEFLSGKVQTLTFYFVKKDGELKLLGILPGEPK